MNDYVFSLLLGIVEGLTEFLPVSSTAHLRIIEGLLAPHFVGMTADAFLKDPFWKMYSVVIQLGAILCLPIYFRTRIWKFLRTFPRGEYGHRSIWNHPLSLTLIAFVVTAGPAYLLKSKIGENLENLKVMGAALLVGGAVMWAVDFIYPVIYPPKKANPSPSVAPAEGQPAGDHRVMGLAYALNPSATIMSDDELPRAGFHRTEQMEGMNLLQAVWIGAAQILSAVFPGTSRSMSTIAAGQLAGMDRPSALEFSFFLSIPTMVVATGFEFLSAVGLRKSKHADAVTPVIHMTGHTWILLAIGFVVSFFVAWVVVAWFMAWVRRRGFVPFAVYRIVVGTAVLAWAFHHA
jgi:undecaprenyl-diphosphatase